MRKFSGRGHVIIIIIPFSVRLREANRYRDRDRHGFLLSYYKLLYKKLESRLLDYLALTLVSYTLGLIVDRGIARAPSSLVHTCKRKYLRMCKISLYNTY